MSILLTSDLHLDNKPENQYRFDFLKYLIKEVITYDVVDLFILGDITDSKDNHNSKLVNKIIAHLAELAYNCKIHILVGNHDYIDKNEPYFCFINKLDPSGQIEYITCPTDISTIDDYYICALPHTRTPEKDWEDMNIKNKGFDYIFMHQTVAGAKASNGIRLEGISNDFIKEHMKGSIVYSGDVHVPQKIGVVEYVGSPYHVRFGDNFTPRYIIIDKDKDNEPKDYFYAVAPRKIKLTINNVEDLNGYKFKSGDMVKIDLKLDKSEWVDWKNHKIEIEKWCNKCNIILKGIKVIEREQGSAKKKKIKGTNRTGLSKDQLFDDFCNNRKLDKYRKDIGREFLNV